MNSKKWNTVRREESEQTNELIKLLQIQIKSEIEFLFISKYNLFLMLIMIIMIIMMMLMLMKANDNRGENNLPNFHFFQVFY